MSKAAANLAETSLETSAKIEEHSIDLSLDDSFVEGKLENPSEKWSGENLDLPKKLNEDVPDDSSVEKHGNELNEQLNGVDWSPEIKDSIRSVEELKVYKDADLQEGKVNDRPCLQNPEIDWEQRSRVLTPSDNEALARGELPFGFGTLDDFLSMTNKELALNGFAPLDKNYQPIELHHVGQRMDSPLAELTSEQHHGNDAVLHEKNAPSQIDRNAFNAERAEYWKARAKQL